MNKNDKWMECGQGTLIHPVTGKQVTTEVVELAGFGRIFEVYHYGNNPDGDMRLIRSAPELLEALKTVLEICPSPDIFKSNITMANQLRDASKQIKEAITLATGKEQAP